MSAFIIHEIFMNKLFGKNSIVPLPKTGIKTTKTHKTKKSNCKHSKNVKEGKSE